MKDKIERYLKVFSALYIILAIIIFVITFQVHGLLSLLSLLFSMLLFVGVIQHKAQIEKLIKDYASQKVEMLDDAIKNSFRTFPVSIVTADREGAKIHWANDEFKSNFGLTEELIEKPVYEWIEDLTHDKIKNYYINFPCEINFGEKIYRVFAKSEDKTKDYINLYFIDVTNDAKIRVEYTKTKPVVNVISIDNYDDLLRNVSDAEKSSIVAAIDTKINEWAKDTGAILRKFDRDRFLFIVANDKFEELKRDKFTVLNDVRQIETTEEIPATLSIGIGKEGANLNEAFQFAQNALEMALSRGGDQVVLKNPNTFEFFGGTSKEFEKRTKVKARVVANAINQIIKDSEEVYIMGHKTADFDALGAAIGMCAAIRALDKPYKIIIDRTNTAATPLIERLLRIDTYKNVFIDPEEALLKLSPGSLLMVVDTTRPSQVESLSILEAANKVVVIDHHRRAADYIDNAAVSMHEPYASSTCEIVTELLQYMLTSSKITKAEAEALMSGIVLDTKNFITKTGSRTFETAAYLKRIGADVESVRALFQNDFETSIVKHSVITGSKIHKENYVISITSEEVSRAVAASACDECLNILNIQASFVIFKCNDKVHITARSKSKVNVQLIMESLGGGGSMNAAACAFESDTTENIERRLIEAIDKYNLNYNNNEEDSK